MDMFVFLGVSMLNLLLFHFNMTFNILVFLILILLLFKLFKLWIGLNVFLVYLGGLLILMIYISSFSKKKSFSFKKTPFICSILVFLPLINQKFWLWESYQGFDILMNKSMLWIFFFVLFFFFLILFSIGTFSPLGKTIRSL